MSAEERKKILQMVADGKISAEQAASLMRALDEDAEEQIQVIQPEAGRHAKSQFSPGEPVEGSERSDSTEFDEVRKRARRFAFVPLWIGITITLLAAWGMFGALQSSGYNFWFFCLSLPLLLGILLIAIGGASATARWIYVNVDRSQQNEWPQHITLALPLPLGLVSWVLENFGRYISGLKNTNVDDVIHAIALTKSIKEPLIVNVEDGKDGEKVQVFIG